MANNQKPYGCFNRPEFRTVYPAQDGWWVDGTTRVAKLTSIPFRMNFECQYRHSELGKADKNCIGCKHRKAA
jgi:hypothetical protein